MEPACVRHDLIPGTSQLFLDYLYNFDRVSRFYRSGYWEANKLADSARQVAYPVARRTQMTTALREQNGDSLVLEKFAEPGTVAVVTGQQVGLFSGPAYTIFKALTAVKLADYLNQQGVSAVPVFWLPTEDHDLAEVDHAWVFNHKAVPAKVSIAHSVVNGGPVGEVVLNEVPLAELRQALGELPFADEVIKRVEAAYRPGVTLGRAFRAFLQDLLKDFGLLFLDPLAPAVREIAAPFLSEAAERVPHLVEALRRRNSELSEAGYHAQVHVEDDSSLLFLLGDGRRTAIRWKDGRFVSRECSYNVTELKSLGGRLSPNALLRPVMQDYLLPTASYIAGPAEIAYLAQSEVLYQELLGRMPVVYPRNGFTLLDAHADKLLERYDFRLPDLLDYQEKVKSRIAAKLVPHDLSEEFTKVRASTAQTLERLEADLREFDRTLEAAAKKSSAKILYQLDKLARKTARETLLRDERASKDAAYLIDLIYPQRQLQERFYSIVPFLAKHGPDLPQKLFGLTQLNCPDHMLRTV